MPIETFIEFCLQIGTNVYSPFNALRQAYFTVLYFLIFLDETKTIVTVQSEVFMMGFARKWEHPLFHLANGIPVIPVSF